MIPDVIKKNNLAKSPDECINISGDDSDPKYYYFSISKKTLDVCKDINFIPFTILVKKGTLDIYTNQGNEKDKFHLIE